MSNEKERPVDLAPIRARLAAATPGPWSVNMLTLTIWNARRGLVASVFNCDEYAAECDATAGLLVRAPEDLAALCDAVEHGREMYIEKSRECSKKAGVMLEQRAEIFRQKKHIEQLEAMATEQTYRICFSCKEGGGEPDEYMRGATERGGRDEDGNWWCDDCVEANHQGVEP